MIRTTLQGVPTEGEMVLTYEIVEKLCHAYCTNAELGPFVQVRFSVSDSKLVGTILYATIQAIIEIQYKPRGCAKKCSSMKTEIKTENFVIAFANATSETAVEVVNTDGYTEPSYFCNSECSFAQGIRQVGTITIT